MDYKSLEDKYRTLIQKIIEDNKKFYELDFDINIKWKFFADENVSLVAKTNRKTLELEVNIFAVDFSHQINEPLTIEYYILHEIRHIYQIICVNNISSNKCPDLKKAKIYEKEFKNYSNPLRSTDSYFNQFTEFEAFVFSYSAMKYKYGDIKYINYPDFYNKQNFDIEKHIKNWLEIFKNKNLFL